MMDTARTAGPDEAGELSQYKKIVLNLLNENRVMRRELEQNRKELRKLEEIARLMMKEKS